MRANKIMKQGRAAHSTSAIAMAAEVRGAVEGRTMEGPGPTTIEQQ
jgi:hypothetical protein